MGFITFLLTYYDKKLKNESTEDNVKGKGGVSKSKKCKETIDSKAPIGKLKCPPAKRHNKDVKKSHPITKANDQKVNKSTTKCCDRQS